MFKNNAVAHALLCAVLLISSKPAQAMRYTEPTYYVKTESAEINQTYVQKENITVKVYLETPTGLNETHQEEFYQARKTVIDAQLELVIGAFNQAKRSDRYHQLRVMHPTELAFYPANNKLTLIKNWLTGPDDNSNVSSIESHSDLQYNKDFNCLDYSNAESVNFTETIHFTQKSTGKQFVMNRYNATKKFLRGNYHRIYTLNSALALDPEQIYMRGLSNYTEYLAAAQGRVHPSQLLPLRTFTDNVQREDILKVVAFFSRTQNSK